MPTPRPPRRLGSGQSARRRSAAASVGAALIAVALTAACSSGGPSSGSTSDSDALLTTPTQTAPSAPTESTPSSTSAAGTPTSRAASATSHPATHSPSPSPTRTSHPAPTRTAAALPTFPPGSGPKVVLDPGHNGGNASHAAEINRQVPAGFGKQKSCNTTGTSTNAGYAEHSFNWDVAQRVKKILVAHGVRVIETRGNDTGVGPCVNVRAQIESEQGVAAAIAIHADGAPSGGHGFHVCYASRRPDGASAATMAANRTLSVAVHNALQSGSGLVPSTYIGSDGYYPRSDEAGINLSTSPTTFLELGNMRNAHDAALQSSAGGRQRIATAVADGILAYLGTR